MAIPRMAIAQTMDKESLILESESIWEYLRPSETILES